MLFCGKKKNGMGRIKKYLALIIESIHEKRRWLLALSCLVVFITTYVLILPAFTLTQEKAEQQGGIDIPAMEMAAEEAADEETGSVDSENKADADTKTTDKAKAENKSEDKYEASAETETETANSSVTKAAAQTDPLTFEGEGFTVAVDDAKSVLPVDTEVVASELLEKPEEGTKAEKKEAEEAYKKYYELAQQAVKEEDGADDLRIISFVKFYDISLQSAGEVVQPDKPVNVTISYDKDQQKDLKVDEKKNVKIIHFAEDQETGEITAELLKEDTVDVSLEKKQMAETTFEAESFSVYGVVYTVDISYEVDGKTYEYSIKGGEGIGLSELLPALGVIKDDKDTDIDEVKEFIGQIEDVKFSDTSLVSVSKADSDITVGGKKDALGLECEYSAELSDEQKKEINSKAIKAGDWALISLKAFDTEETLTITMKNGDAFEVKVTDGQNVTDYKSIVPGREYILYVVRDGNEYYALGNDGRSHYVGSTIDDLAGLNSSFSWNYGLDETSCWWYSGNTYLNLANSNNRNVIGAQKDYVFMSPFNNGFDIYRYDDGKHLSWDTSGFKVTDHRDVSIRVYMKDKPNYDFTVASNNENYGSVSCTETKTNTNKKNKTDIIATVKDDCYFSGWRLGDEVLTNFGTTIPAGTLTFPEDNMQLTALFGKNYTSQATQEINEWVDGLLGNPIISSKTAHVYDYDNRIYEVDISASSKRYTVNSGLTLEFVTDASRSMYFPAQITPATERGGSYVYNGNIDLGQWLSNYGVPGETYYVVSDVGKTATMYAVYWGKRDNVNQWLYTDASYYKAPDGKTKTIFKVGDIQNGQVGDKNYLLSGTIYTAPNKESGKDWSRLDYLRSALLAATRALYRLDPSAQIGLVTFANEVLDQPQNSGVYRISADANNESTITNAINSIWTSGGTNQQAALNYYWKSDAARKDLTVFTTTSTRKQVAVLITDGAPNQSSVNWNTIGNSATNLRGRNVDLYTLGLSLNDVGEANKSGLNGIAGTPSGTDLSYAFQAEKGEEFAGKIEDMLLKILDKATLVGEVTDTIDPAFYPVTEDGMPIASGTTVIQPDGKKATYVENDNGSWTVRYSNVEIGWPAVDSEDNPILDEKGNIQTPGWKTSIYIKAKEDFMGGNKISTNTGINDQVTATGYKQTTAPDGVRSFTTPFVNLLSVPYVNVDELTFTENSTEWRVYLGTDVDAKEELLQLWDKIYINQVVKNNGEDDEIIKITHSNQMLYDDAKDNDAANPTSTNNEILHLSHFMNTSVLEGLLKQLDSDNTNDTATLTYRYFPYGHDVVGTFDVELTKNVNSDAAKDHAPYLHTTKEVGDNKEVYTIKVTYTPVNDGASEDYGKTTTIDKSAGKIADGYNGETGELLQSENTHKIHVFAKGLQITKTDEADSVLTGSEFTLYRTAREDDDESMVTTPKGLNGNWFPVAVFETGATGTALVESVERLDAGETYYLVETVTPAGYNTREPVEATLTITDSYTPKPGTTAQDNKPTTGLYNWAETAILALDHTNVSGVTQTDESGETDLTNTGVNPDSTSEIMYYRLVNSSGATLPHTGGIGTTIFYIVGSLLVIGSAIVLISRRRIRK